MAQKGLAQAAQQQHLDLTLWAGNLMLRLRKNFDKQFIYPGGAPGPYIGYRNTANYRRHKAWKQRHGINGTWLDSFAFKVYAAANGDTEKVSFFFREYIYMVDWGVSRKHPIESIDDASYANWSRRYGNWAKEGDNKQRPAMMMEFRYQMFRLSSLTTDYYQRLVENALTVSFMSEDDARRELSLS